MVYVTRKKSDRFDENFVRRRAGSLEKNKGDTMKEKFEKLKFWLVIAAAVIVAIFVTSLFMKERFSSHTEVSVDLITNRLASAKKLITTEYHYTNMGAMENQNEFYGWKVPFTKKSFILSYDGVIYMGVDIDKAEIQVEGKEIRIALPEAEILSHDIKEDSITIFDEKTSVFNPIEISDYITFSVDQQKVMEEKVLASGYLLKARKNAQEAIGELLRMNPEISEGYQIVFR